MENKIEILCPSRQCPRCKKMITYLERLIAKNNWDAKIVVVTSLKELLKFNTWILPSVFVNGAKVARGYKPIAKDIVPYLK